MDIQEYENKKALMITLQNSKGWQVLMEELDNTQIKDLKNRLLTQRYDSMELRDKDVEYLELLEGLKVFPETFIKINAPLPETKSESVYE